MTTLDLFSSLPDGAKLLRAFATDPAILAAVDDVVAKAPLRKIVTPGGHTMSVAMTNCGALGWTSDLSGYRYVSRDPITDMPWPAMPPALVDVAVRAAAAAGYEAFAPDACLINEYVPGAKMTLHQDRNERDLAQPIVSVSLGLAAVFLFGGATRSDRATRVPLGHGDVVVWGGPARLFFHGVLPVADGEHPLLGRRRVNLTFRRAGP